MTELGQAYQAPSWTGCHSARKPFPPAKHANSDNCGILEGQNTLGFKNSNQLACVEFPSHGNVPKPSDSWWTRKHKEKEEKPHNDAKPSQREALVTECWPPECSVSEGTKIIRRKVFYEFHLIFQ